MRRTGATGLPKLIDRKCGTQTYTAVIKAKNISDTDTNADAWKALLAVRIHNHVVTTRTIQNIQLQAVINFVNLRESKWKLLTTISGADAFMIWAEQKCGEIYGK